FSFSLFIREAGSKETQRLCELYIYEYFIYAHSSQKKNSLLPQPCQTIQKCNELHPLVRGILLQQLTFKLLERLHTGHIGLASLRCKLCKHSTPIARLMQTLDEAIGLQAIYQCSRI